MEWFYTVYALILGIVTGSFLNVLIYRIPRNISFAKGSSFCPACRHKLGAGDLVPVLSWAALRGRCRYCGAGIPARYPAVELLTGVLFLLAYHVYGLSFMAFISAAALSCLVTIAVIDFDHQIIPDRLNLALAVCGLLAGLLSREMGWAERLIGVFAVSVPVLVLALTVGGMGEGDVKLFAALGLLLGWKQILLTLLIAAVPAAVYGILVAARRKTGGKTQIPFGPFIALGAAAALLFGRQILSFYLSLIP